MEPAKIDWESLNSEFVVDDLYEDIKAPQWVDFSAPDQSVDDEAWFCRRDCRHPKTVEDFLEKTPPSKLQRSPTVSEILPLRGNRRDANLKKRGPAQPLLSPNKGSNCDRFAENGENQNPNFCTTPSHQYNIMKAAIKPSTEKKKIEKEGAPQLKNTLSARNLFAGRDIMGQITEFCNDLKRLATRVKERENGKKGTSVAVRTPEAKECACDNSGELDEKEKERKPLLEMNKEKCEAMEKRDGKEKPRRKKRAEEAENTPITASVKNIKRNDGESLLQIRTCPPSPQCFSANHEPSKITPLKASRCRPQERGVIQQLEQSYAELRKDEAADNNNRVRFASVVAEREAKTLDVFWFLKPCTTTLSS